MIDELDNIPEYIPSEEDIKLSKELGEEYDTEELDEE